MNILKNILKIFFKLYDYRQKNKIRTTSKNNIYEKIYYYTYFKELYLYLICN
jgi:hypothetical protein